MDKIIQSNIMNGDIYTINRCTKNAQPETYYEPSWHDFFEVYWFLDGDIMFAFEGEMLDIIPGEMIIISNHQLHRPMLKSNCTYHRKRITFSPDTILKLDYDGANLYRLLTSRKIIRLSKEIVKEHKLDILFNEIEYEMNNSSYYHELATAIKLFYFLIKSESVCQNNITASDNICNNVALEIINYINKNISSDLSYKKIAEKFFFTSKNLYKVFKKETGFTLANYVKQRRIINAKALLSMGHSAIYAASASGFKDYSVFYRSFIKETGVSPTAYPKP